MKRVLFKKAHVYVTCAVAQGSIENVLLGDWKCLCMVGYGNGRELDDSTAVYTSMEKATKTHMVRYGILTVIT